MGSFGRGRGWAVARPSRSPGKPRATPQAVTPRSSAALGRDPVAERAFGFLRPRGSFRRADLLRLLAHLHQVPADSVLHALRADPRFVVGEDQIRLASSHTPPPEPNYPATEPGSELQYQLSLLETDTVLLSLDGHVRLRCDFVRTDRGDQIWVSAKVVDQSLHTRLAAVPGAHQPGPGLRLPLRPATAEPAEIPGLLVWRATTPALACQAVELAQQAWPTPGRWRIEVEVCSTAELERRVSGERLIRRLGSRAQRGTPVRDCAHCGLPLSDPTSVRLGIGPECYSRYHSEVRHAAVTRKPGTHVRLGAKKPKHWLRDLRPWLAEPAKP